MFLGMDIGSSSSKAAIVNFDGEIVGACVVNMGTGTTGAEDALKMLYDKTGLSNEDISYSIATGYGRNLYKDADEQVTEITCHARGVAETMENIRTIIDIGGQDSKVIKMDSKGRVVNFAMNEKCAAGTGRFMEVMARVLGYPIGDLSELYYKATHSVPISSVCTVFAESEVISRLATGESIENVARGAHEAISKRVVGMVGRVGGEPKYAMTGGVSLNKSMADALANEIGDPVTIAPYPQENGAIGAAFIARDKYLAQNENIRSDKIET